MFLLSFSGVTKTCFVPRATDQFPFCGLFVIYVYTFIYNKEKRPQIKLIRKSLDLYLFLFDSKWNIKLESRHSTASLPLGVKREEEKRFYWQVYCLIGTSTPLILHTFKGCQLWYCWKVKIRNRDHRICSVVFSLLL